MPRPEDFGNPQFGYDASWNSMRDEIYERSGEDIDDDPGLRALFNELLPDNADAYPAGSRDAVDMYVYNVTEEIQEYLNENYGDDYRIWDFFDWQDWRENYDSVA